MAGTKYQGMTYEEMEALVNKNYSSLTPEEKAMMGQLTKQDYDDYAREVNWATSTPTYTGWNGGSVTGQDAWQATMDSIQHGYDVWLDPRNGTGGMINNLLQNVDMKANADAVNGIGDYDTNRQNYLNQIGWTNYQDIFKRLQDTGSLGLTDLEGNDLTQMALAERDKMLPGTPYELTPEMMQQMQNEYAAMVAQQNNVNPYLSPLMNQQGGSGKGGAWGYDMEGDPVWQAYLKQYSRAADKGMNDALAQLSARTGGIASSYAGQVAQQTHNDIMQGATDMIPQLEQQAYDRDLTERQMAIDAEQRQYERQMAAEQQQYERMMAQQQLAADQQAQNASLLLSLMENYGYVPSDEELAAAGLGRGMADAMNAGYQNKLALEWAKVNKTTGGKPVTPTITDAIYQQMADAGLSEGEAYAHLRGTYGLDDDEAVPYVDYYLEFLEGMMTPDEILGSVKDYQGAVDALQKLGVEEDVVNGLMDMNTWHRQAGTMEGYKDGITPNASVSYASYADYLNAYLRWVMEMMGQ